MNFGSSVTFSSSRAGEIGKKNGKTTDLKVFDAEEVSSGNSFTFLADKLPSGLGCTFHEGVNKVVYFTLH